MNQFLMRMVLNAEALRAAISQLEVAIERGTSWSSLEAAVKVGIQIGLGRALPNEYHAGRRSES